MSKALNLASKELYLNPVLLFKGCIRFMKSLKLSELQFHQLQKLKQDNVHKLSLWILKYYRYISWYYYKREKNFSTAFTAYMVTLLATSCHMTEQICLIGMELLQSHLHHLPDTEVSTKCCLDCSLSTWPVSCWHIKFKRTSDIPRTASVY